LVFTQFSYAGVAEAGAGLTRTGTVFILSYDTGLFQIGGGNLLQIRSGAISNGLLANSTTAFASDSGTATISLGGTLNIFGSSNGIDTTISGSTLTIALDLNEVSTVTTIDDADFIVGVKSSNSTNQKITFANLKSFIGAASQLAIGVESGTAASLDLDTDTLNFATGNGLTFTRSNITVGTTDTLTVTLSNNTLYADQFTNVAFAANGNNDYTITDQAADIFSVTLNGVSLKKGTNWEWPVAGDYDVVKIKGLPYAVENSDELEITYRGM
jgi:hypothetical protein